MVGLGEGGLKERGFDPAAVDGIRAAGMERATGRGMAGRRHFAASDAGGTARSAGFQDGLPQEPGIGVAGLLEHLGDVADLDDAAQIHDGHAMRDGAHHAQVVRDEEVGQTMPVAQIDQEVEDLRADRDIQGADRLIADHQLGMQRQGAGDTDPLALAAREFMGEPVEGLVAHSHLRQQPARDWVPFVIRQPAVGAQAFGDDFADGEAWIERLVGILENHLEVRPLGALVAG